jgi:diaminopropionate ammonia-lyase
MTHYFINNPGNKITSNLTTEILKGSQAMEYHKSLPVYQSTPLVSLPYLAQKYNVANIYVKDESHRFGLNAFKGLGASYAVHKILEHQPNIEFFCTATDGNHGRAVAWASRINNKKAMVFVPAVTTESRIQAIKNEGAEVIKIDGNYDDACSFAKEASKSKGWQLVQDAAWEDYEEIPAHIMAGYLTLFQEIENELHSLPMPKIDVVLLQAGVGSWAGSAIWYYLNRYGEDRPRIVVVQPFDADGILSSFKANKRVNPCCTFNTIMAGLNCGIPSSSAWDILKNGTDISIKVKDELAEQAIRDFYFPDGNDKRIVSGESGAAGLAGLIALMTESDFQVLKEKLKINPASSVLLYNTEGATDIENFKKITSMRL